MTRQYTVYITDEKNSVQGSGVLYYPGGNSLFVFTCAHVVEHLDQIHLFILNPIDIATDQYDVLATIIPKSQIIFSPLRNQGTDEEASEDFAIIELKKTEDFEIAPSNYCVGESSRNAPIYAQGYPGGVPTKQHPIEYLECFHGTIFVSRPDSNRFTIRIVENFIDLGQRFYELKGMSGAPIWDAQESADSQSLLGLVSTGYDQTIYLSRIFAAKAQQIRSLLNEKFGITIERRLADIPEEDMAVDDFKLITFDGTVKHEGKTEAEKWIEEQTSACRCFIDDLKLRRAIETGKAAIEDDKFSLCSTDSQKKLMQHLLYCYEICDMDAEFKELETKMVEQGLFKKYDILRHLTRSFMKKQYQETITVAEECIADPDNTEKATLIACARTFLMLSRAYTEELSVAETIGTLLDEHGNFIYKTDKTTDASLLYQMIGYVYGEKYHDYVNSVRFLNRSYKFGFDNIVLESLGAAYYSLGIAGTRNEEGLIDYRKIDQKALYKARECFLIIIQKADDLFWKGSILRVGLHIYDTFVFLQDNYRILTIYPDIKKYVKFVKTPEQKDEWTFWRDIEMKHAKVIAQSGTINTNDYSHLGRLERIYLETFAKTTECLSNIDQATLNLNADQINASGLERYVKNVIRETENNVRIIDKHDRIPLYIQLMNMYGRGMRLFGWDKLNKLKYCKERLQWCGSNDLELLDTMKNVIYEFEAPIDDVIDRFRQSFEKWKNLRAWQELIHLYIRHGMMDKADGMYRELLAERKELITESPEYAYRAYIDYIIMYRRDLKDALQCYLDAKEAFKDTDIEGFWELELMVYTNCFNDPDRFEIEREPFLEKGLLTEEQYHRTAFIAYMVNLDEEKARKHNEYIRQYPHFVNPVTNMLILDRAEIFFLNWVGEIKPNFLPPPKSMIADGVDSVLARLRNETWHREIDQPTKNQFSIDKKVVIDAWSLYILAETGRLEELRRLDTVYVTHYTTTRLLDEISRTNNNKLRELLDFIKNLDNVQLFSAGFKTQITVRNVTLYTEMAGAVAAGIEEDCLTILGEPDMDKALVEKFSNRIIRFTDMDKLFE